MNFLLDTTNTSGTFFEQYGMIIMLVALVAVFYFFMIRPQKKQEKKDAEMRGALQVGDEVTTIGGIIGKVVSIKEDTFVLETTKDKTKIRFLRGAIRSVDVRVADINAAANIETKNGAAPAEEKPVKRGLFGRKKAKAEKKPAEAAPATEEEKK